jgi:hypothetical protein
MVAPITRRPFGESPNGAHRHWLGRISSSAAASKRCRGMLTRGLTGRTWDSPSRVLLGLCITYIEIPGAVARMTEDDSEFSSPVTLSKPGL